MLPAPARDDAAQAIAKVRRIADSARTRRLDMLEHLWKGTAWDERPSFWDASVPLNERGTCVQSSIAEASGGRIVNLVFGESRFPTLTVGASAFGVSVSEDERASLGHLVAELVRVACMRTGMRSALEQGLMSGTVVAVAGIKLGVPVVSLLAAKYCERDVDENGDVTRLEYRYRYSAENAKGEECVYWYRRVIDAQSDTTWQGVPVREDGYLPDWDEHRVSATTIAHGLGFCPVLWHRNMPDVSDTDPIDGSALFAGLEDEIFALDMAMSQRHRNGRYNGEPQIVRIGFGDAAMGEMGRAARPMPDLGKPGAPDGGSWFSRAYDAAGKFLGSSGAAAKKAPGKFWNAPAGADVKMLESTGAGAQILASDIDGLRQSILEARSIVIASPETLSANASAALLRQIFEPMLALADNLREEYGEVLCRLVNLLLRVCYAMRARGLSVFVAGLDECMVALSRCNVIVAGQSGQTRRWVGLGLSPTWGEYFEPTWQDVTNALQAALNGNGGMPVLTTEQSVRLVARVVGITDVDAYLASLTGATSESHAAANEMLKSVLGDAAPQTTPAPEQAVADTAMNGAQVASLQGIVTAAASGELPIGTAAEMIALAFPTMDRARIDAMLAPIGQVAGIAAQHADLQAEHAALKASHASKSRMLDNVLAHNAAGKLVQGSPVGLGNPDAPGAAGASPNASE